MKFVKKLSEPLDPIFDLQKIKHLAENCQANIEGEFRIKGQILDVSKKARDSYVSKVLSFADFSLFNPLKIVVNSGNGAAGPTLDSICKEMHKKYKDITIYKKNHVPDPSFPNGIPNPLLVKNQGQTSKMVIEAGANFGVAFDGDFDRCFFFDERGIFVPGEYIVGLLSEIFLEKEPGSKLVYDCRVTFNTEDIIRKSGGVGIISRTGHAFLKQKMRKHKAIYGGEISAHHYFRDFCYCDSGMIPWLLIAEKICSSGKSLSVLIKERQKLFPSSGEINFELQKPMEKIKKVENFYRGKGLKDTDIDGLSIDFGDWRFNLRSSNTEALVRLNLETRGSKSLLERKLTEIMDIILI